MSQFVILELELDEVVVVVVVVGKVVGEVGLGRRKEYMDQKRKTARAVPPAKMRELEKREEAAMDVVNEEKMKFVLGI